jgi:hypothetical protein
MCRARLNILYVTFGLPYPPDSGARIQIEDRFPRGLLQDLMARGHRFQKIGRKGEVRYGYAATAMIYSVLSLACTLWVAVHWRAHLWRLEAPANAR